MKSPSGDKRGGTTGREVTDMKEISEHTQLKQGAFRLTSYEWGVTYSAALAAYRTTGDAAYRDYVVRRHRLLADVLPYYQELFRQGKDIDGNIRRVVDPRALDDAGALCTSMNRSAGFLDKPSVTLRDAERQIRPS